VSSNQADEFTTGIRALFRGQTVRTETATEFGYFHLIECNTFSNLHLNLILHPRLDARLYRLGSIKG
jgi:hypothetical protein